MKNSGVTQILFLIPTYKHCELDKEALSTYFPISEMGIITFPTGLL